MFRIATCFVILEICANIDGKTNEDKSVHVDLETILAFNNKDNLQNVKLIGNFQDFLTNVRRTVARTGRKRDVKFRTRRIESTRYENATKFTDFIQKLIKILKHYKDHDLEDVFGIAKSVSRIYHYEGCKIDELVSHGIVRRYIDANFEFFNDKPARDIRQGLENLHQLIEDAKYKPKQSQFLDFINSLYTNEHMLEHVKKILDQFESFQMPSKRTTIDLIDLVRDTIRSVIFDHYSNLSLDTRRDFKAKLEALIWDDVKNADKVQHLEWTLDYTEITKNIAPLLRDNTPTTIPDMGIELKTENEFDMVSKENKKGQNIESKSNDDSNDHGISDDDQPENGGHMLGIMTDQDDISINKQDIQIEYNTNEKRDSKSNDTSNDHDISDNDQPENRYQTMGIMMDQDNMRIIKQDSTTSIHHIYSAEEDFTTKRKKYNIFKHTTMFRAPYGEEERILTNGNIAKTPVTKKYKHTDHDSLNLDTETSSKAEKERMTKSPRNILATKTPKKHKLRNTDSRIEYQIVKTKVAHGKGNKHIKNGSLNKYLETIYLDKDDELSMKFSVPKKNYDKRSSEIEDLARSSENIQKFGDLLHDKVSIQDEKSQGVKRSIKNREPKSNMKKGIKTLSEIETLESTEEDVHKKIPRTLSSSIENLSGMLEKESSAMNYMDKESHTFKKKAKRFKVIKKEQSFSKEQSISMKSIEKSVEEEEPYHKVQKSSQKQSTKRKPHKYKEKTIGKTKRPKRIKKEHSFSNEQSISLKSIEKTAEDTEPYQEDLESSYKKPKKKGESKHKLKYKRIKNEHNFSHKNPGSLKSNEMSAEDEEPYQKEHESSYEKSKNKESKNMKEKIKRHKHLKKEHSSSHEQPISLKSFEKSPEDEETYHKELKSSYEKSKNRESHDMKENIKKHKRIKKEHSFSQEELNSLISIENSAEDEESYQKEQESSSENSKIKGSHNLKEKIKRHKVMKKEHVLSHEQSISLKSNEKSAKDKAIKSHKKPKELPKQIKSPKAKGSDIKLKQKRQESSDKQIEKFTTEASRLRKSSRHSTSDTEKHTLEIKSAGSIEDSIATTQNKDETTIKKKDKAGYNVDEYTTLITKITGLVERPLDLKGIDNLDKKSSTDSVFHRVVYDETTNSNEKYKAVNIPIKAHISSRFLDETIVRNSGLKSQFRRSNNKDDDRNTYLAKNARSFVVLSDLVNNQTFNVDFNALSNNLTTAYNQNQSNSMNQDFRRRQIGNRAKMKRLKKMYKTLYSMTTTSPRPSRQIINAITNKVDSSTTTASTTTASEVSSITSTKEEYSTIPATAAFTITFTNKEFTTTFIKYPTIISTAKATSSTKMSTSSISSSEISISNSSTATTPLVTSSDKPTTTQNTTASTTKKKRRKKKKRKRRRSTIKSISTLSSPTSVFTATTVAARSTATKPNITTIIEPSSTTAKPSVTFNELTTISPEPTTTVTNITITDNKTNKTTAMSSQIKQPQDYRRSNILDTAKALESHPNTTKLMKDNAIDLEYANYDVHTTFNNEPVIPDSHKEAKELFERLGIDKDNPKNQTDVDPEYAELPFPHLDKNAELKAEMGRIQVNKDMLNVFGHTARSLPEFSTAPGNTLFTDPFDMISDPLMFEFL